MSKSDHYTRGVLYSRKSEKHYTLTRVAPRQELSCMVETYWHVSWDLRDGEQHVQQNIPDPCINIVFEMGANRIVGAVTKRYSVELAGKGTIFGIKFLPAAFAPLSKFSVSSFTDSSLKIEDIFGPESHSLVKEINSAKSIEAMVRASENFLIPRIPDSIEEVRKLGKIIRTIEIDSNITKVSHLSEKFGLSDRTLQRLFKDKVGVSPKWIIKKYRMQGVLSRLENGDHDWQSLINGMGYFDQPHFIKDFKSLIGVTPTEYVTNLSKTE